jgi:hypothetical protein
MLLLLAALENGLGTPNGPRIDLTSPEYALLDILKRLMQGGRGCSQIHFGVAEVRDVADLTFMR